MTILSWKSLCLERLSLYWDETIKQFLQSSYITDCQTSMHKKNFILHANFFQREHKHTLFTFYVIAPQWHGTGISNPSLCKARTHLFYLGNITWLMMLIMTMSSNGNIFALLALCAGNSPVTGEFPSQRPVTQSFDVFFDLCLNKRLGKQSWGWWFEMPLRPLWHHCNVSIRPKGTNLSEMTIKIWRFSFTKMYLKMSSANGNHFVLVWMW